MRQLGNKCNLLKWLAACALAMLLVLGVHAEPMRVAYPQPQIELDRGYFVKMLELVMRKSGAKYQLQTWDVKAIKGRAVQELAHGSNVDVIWAMTTREREQLLLPVRIPLDMGLAGWRIGVVNAQDSAKFEAVRTVDQLRQYRIGQGYDWADTTVLKASGFDVVTGATADNLHAMLAVKRFDYFPRSIRQVWGEAEQHAAQGEVVEMTLALHYPAAVYFFVNKNNPALAEALEAGLKRARRDGSFEQLFRSYNADLIRRTRLSQRIVLELPNPDLPDETPLQHKELWYSPTRY